MGALAFVMPRLARRAAAARSGRSSATRARALPRVREGHAIRAEGAPRAELRAVRVRVIPVIARPVLPPSRRFLLLLGTSCGGGPRGRALPGGASSWSRSTRSAPTTSAPTARARSKRPPSTGSRGRRPLRVGRFLRAAHAPRPRGDPLGLLPPSTGLRNNGAGAFPADRETLATRLRAAGYRTGAFVGAFVLDHRFGLAAASRPTTTTSTATRRRGVARAERRGSEVVDRALAWLRSLPAGPDARFFLWVHLYDPHAPYDPPEPYRSRHAARPYDGEIAFADAQIKRVLDALDERGVAARTSSPSSATTARGWATMASRRTGFSCTSRCSASPRPAGRPGCSPRPSRADARGHRRRGPDARGLLGVPRAGRTGGARSTAGPLGGPRRGPRARSRRPLRRDEYPRMFGWSGLATLRRERSSTSRRPARSFTTSPRTPSRGRASRPATIARRPWARRWPRGRATPGRAHRRRSTRRRGSAWRASATSAGRRRRPLPGPSSRTRRTVSRPTRPTSGGPRPGRGRIDEARAALERLVAEEPRNPVFRGLLAKAAPRPGRPGPRARLHRETAALAPRDPDARYNLAAVLEEAGRPSEALVEIDELLRLDAGRPEAQNLRGSRSSLRATCGGARRLRAGRGPRPARARAQNNRGNVLRQLRRWTRPRKPTGRPRSGSALRRRLERPRALLVARGRPPRRSRSSTGPRPCPGLVEARLNRAIALELQGDYPSALAAYREFLEASRMNPVAKRSGAPWSKSSRASRRSGPGAIRSGGTDTDEEGPSRPRTISV